MAFEVIDPTEIEVGKTTKKRLFRKIKNSLDDHEVRILAATAGSGKIALFNEDVYIQSFDSLTGILYFEVPQDCILSEFSIRIFEKGSATTGNLTIDLKKCANTNDANFTSTMSVVPTMDFSVISNYHKVLGTINSGAQTLLKGDMLRIDVTSLPAKLKRFRVFAIGEF